MQLKQFTERIGFNGKPYPRCQHHELNKQCEKSTYSDGKCWGHYNSPARAMLRRAINQNGDV